MTRPVPDDVVLVTGAASGIGRATVRELAHAGYTVYASARREDAVRELHDEGVREGYQAITLDVDDAVSVARAVDEIVRVHGRLDVLVNNAGYGLHAPVECIPPEALRGILETNVVGAHRMVLAVLPRMRERGHGTIVQLSSVAGRVALPMYGAYSASKYALEALSDALRQEVAPFGVKVVLIEPGPVRTGFSDAAHRHSSALSPAESAYAPLFERMERSREKSRALGGTAPEAVARLIRAVLSEAHPAPRYPITVPARVFPRLQAVVPDRAWDWLVRVALGRAR